jgi:hypothetical protein
MLEGGFCYTCHIRTKYTKSRIAEQGIVQCDRVEQSRRFASRDILKLDI